VSANKPQNDVRKSLFQRWNVSTCPAHEDVSADLMLFLVTHGEITMIDLFTAFARDVLKTENKGESAYYNIRMSNVIYRLKSD